jgi:hypothetical protein
MKGWLNVTLMFTAIINTHTRILTKI